MDALVALFVAVLNGFVMYKLVERHNSALMRADTMVALRRSIEPVTAGILTGLFALLFAPWYFVRMHGFLRGLPLGIGYVLATVVVSFVAYVAAVLGFIALDALLNAF